jgi:hypothetical protein
MGRLRPIIVVYGFLRWLSKPYRPVAHETTSSRWLVERVDGVGSNASINEDIIDARRRVAPEQALFRLVPRHLGLGDVQRRALINFVL